MNVLKSTEVDNAMDATFISEIENGIQQQKIIPPHLVQYILTSIEMQRFSVLNTEKRYKLLEIIDKYVSVKENSALNFLYSLCEKDGHNAATTLPSATFLFSPCEFAIKTNLTQKEGTIYFHFLGVIYGLGITTFSLISLLRVWFYCCRVNPYTQSRYNWNCCWTHWFPRYYS